jgi:hypothetical protein
MPKQIRLNAFDMNCVGHQSPGLWTLRAIVPIATTRCAAGRGALTPPHGCTQGRRPCSSEAMILPVISSYRLVRSAKDLWAGAGWGMGWSPRRAGESLSRACCTRHGPRTALSLSLFRRSRTVAVSRPCPPKPGRRRTRHAIVTRQGGDVPRSGEKELCASSSANRPWTGAAELRSKAASLCSIGNAHPFVPTCPPAEHCAQRQSRMSPRWGRHRRSRRAAPRARSRAQRGRRPKPGGNGEMKFRLNYLACGVLRWHRTLLDVNRRKSPQASTAAKFTEPNQSRGRRYKILQCPS